MDPTKNIGEDSFSELTGGLLTFTSTLGMPKDVLNRSFEALKEQLPSKQSQPLFFWNRRGNSTPVLAGPVALNSNRTVLHALRPGAGSRGATAPRPRTKIPTPGPSRFRGPATGRSTCWEATPSL